MSVKYICPQCQGQLTEVLDSDGGLFICRSDFHGKVAPSFPRETLEIAYGVGSPDKALTVEEVRPTPRAADLCPRSEFGGNHDWHKSRNNEICINCGISR